MSFTSSSGRRPSIWRSRDLVLVTIGQAISALGNGIVATTLLLYMQAHGHSAWAVAGVLAADMVPMVLLAPLAGVIVDRIDSRKLIVLASLWQAACCLALAITSSPVLVFPIVAAIGAGSAVAFPTYSALLPRIVGEDRISAASSVIASTTGLAAIAGPGAGGLLYATTGLRGPFLIDAASFVVLAAAGTAIHTRRGGSPGADEPMPRTRDGITFIWGNPVLRAVLVMAVAFVAVGEAVNVAEVYLVRDTLGQSAAVYGLASTTWALAAIAGSVVGGRFEGVQTSVRALLASGFGLAAAVSLVGLLPSVGVLFAVFCVGGVCNGVLNVCSSALALRTTPDAQRGGVLSTFIGLVRVAGLGSLGLGGALAGAFAPETVFAICGAASIVALAATCRPLLYAHDRPVARGTARVARGLGAGADARAVSAMIEPAPLIATVDRSVLIAESVWSRQS